MFLMLAVRINLGTVSFFLAVNVKRTHIKINEKDNL